MSGGSLSIFWSNGLVTALMLVGLALLLSPLAFWLVGLARGRRDDPGQIDHGGKPAV